MKYDSSMTQFHGDIVSAIKSMIHGDIDKVAELAAEGSPVPLRDYLREKHGRSCHGGNKFDCMSSAFLVKFDHMINNLGDKKLQISWSQVTGFIRKYPAEIFHSEDSYVEEASPGIEVLDLDVRTYNALKRAGISTIADAETQMEQLENIIPKKIETVRDSLAKYKGIPLPGTWVEEDMLGDELTFDEITNMVGELIILDKSTDSQGCYKAVKVEEVFISSDENRCFRYFDGAKQHGTVSEVWFEKNRCKPERAWRIKTNTSDSSPAPAQSQKKSYLDIFKEHYPNVDCDGLYGDYCPAGFFDGAIDETCGSCPVTCESCWDMPANEIWHEKHYVPEEWKAEIEDEEPDSEVIEKELEALAAAVDEVDEKHIDCPHWNKGNTLYNKGYGEVNFKCRKHEENFNNPRKLKTFINNHCYNSIWCNYCHDQEKPQDTSEEISAPAQSEAAAPAVFDYSALDTDTAHSLKECETVIRTETAGYFTLLGAKFKEAQELLANHSSGIFEQWYTSMGFKRQTVYNLIQRYEFSSSPTIGGREEAFEALPLTLSYEISKPAAPAELVEKVLDGDITTNAEYRKLKAELEEAEEKKEFWIKTNSETNKENQQLRADRNIALSRADNAERKLSEAEAKIKKLNEERERNAELEERDDVLQRKNDVLVLKNQELEQRVKELENRPVEVAVQSDEEALAEKDQEISELKEEIARMSDKNVKTFAIKMTIDEFEGLLNILKSVGNDRLSNAIKHAKLLKI